LIRMVARQLYGACNLLPQMNTPRRRADGSSPSDLPLSVLLYRYFFFAWMFRDASVGTFLERAAALQFNRQRRIYLPIYLRRWLVLVVLSCGLGILVESSFAPAAAAALCYGVMTISLAITATIARSWLMLKYC
jgi:hypothetical protein